MRSGIVGVIFPFLSGFFGDCIRQNPQFSTCLKGTNIGLGGALKVIKAVECVSHAGADDQNSMIAHN